MGASRTTDTGAWHGADYVATSTVACTSWFSATSPTYGAVELTAGHCGTGTWKNNGNTLGTTAGLAFGGNVDEQIIPVSSNAGSVWADPGTTGTRPVKGYSGTTNQTIGGLVCTDGTSNREVCSVRIDAVGQSVTYDGHTITGTVKAHQTGGALAFSSGDSGGPVYSIGSTGVYAYGMIAAYVGNANSGWYVPAVTVLNQCHLTIKTS